MCSKSFFFRLLSLSFVFLVPVLSIAQTVTIPIETKHNAIVLKVENGKDVQMVYYGKRLNNSNDYSSIPSKFNTIRDYSGMLNSAFTPSGTRNLFEPAISVVHADGNLSLDLKYVSHNVETYSPNIKLTKIILKDPVYDFSVTLCYQAFLEFDVIKQWSIIEHSEKKPVVLNKFASANLYLNGKIFWLKQFQGDWASEMKPEETLLTHGIKTLDSKLGTRTNLFQPPVFMISMDYPANEESGSVLFGALEWSGNFRFDLEVDPLNNLRIIAGMNNYASAYTLKPKTKFTTPAFISVFSSNGVGEGSRKLHDWARKHQILDGEGSRLTLLNNWEATNFNFNEEKLVELFSQTKKLGVDLFLLDDGWFANKYPRNNDNAGLGDWQVNTAKLPRGVSWLIEEAHKAGVKFGIWIEPEMVNPKSELYEKHPDWVIKQPNRDEYYFRNQLVLDLSNPKVQDFVYESIDGLLSKNPDLAYIKWDCNAVIYNAHSPYLENKSHLYIDYVKGLYSVLDKIRNKYPTIPMMLCSGGGGRVDYGALKYFTEYWPSDNTDPLDRIFIQWEYSYFYPAIASSNHVTDWGNQTIKFRTDVAMMGKLGFDIVVNNLNSNDLLYCQNAIKAYNEVKNTIWHGDQYRLVNPHKNDLASLVYVNKEKSEGIMFSFLVSNRYGAETISPIRLSGLDVTKKYKVEEICLMPGQSSLIDANVTYSGDYLMNIGFNPIVNGARKSVVLKLTEVKK